MLISSNIPQTTSTYRIMICSYKSIYSCLLLQPFLFCHCLLILQKYASFISPPTPPLSSFCASLLCGAVLLVDSLCFSRSSSFACLLTKLTNSYVWALAFFKWIATGGIYKQTIRIRELSDLKSILESWGLRINDIDLWDLEWNMVSRVILIPYADKTQNIEHCGNISTLQNARSWLLFSFLVHSESWRVKCFVVS